MIVLLWERALCAWLDRFSVMTSGGALLNSAKRYSHVDAMRAVAVMLVVVAHAGMGAVVPGGSGVTIFFVISGYVITTVLIRERVASGGFDMREFYFRRFAKLAPPFAVFVVLPSVVAIALGVDLIAGLLSQTFFAYNWAALWLDVSVFPGTGVTWSLAIEEQFYILFAILWVVIVRVRAWRAVTVALAGLVVLTSTVERFVLALDPSASERIYLGTDTRMDAIAFGVLLAIWLDRVTTHQSRRVLAALGNNGIALAAGVVFVLSLVIRDEYFRDTARYTLQAAAAVAFIAWGFGVNRGRIRALLDRTLGFPFVQFIGLASYSIYLAHLPVMLLVAPYVEWLPDPARIAVLVALGTIIGCVSYRFIEIPIHRRVKARGAARFATNSSRRR